MVASVLGTLSQRQHCVEATCWWQRAWTICTGRRLRCALCMNLYWGNDRNDPVYVKKVEFGEPLNGQQTSTIVTEVSSSEMIVRSGRLSPVVPGSDCSFIFTPNISGTALTMRSRIALFLDWTSPKLWWPVSRAPFHRDSTAWKPLVDDSKPGPLVYMPQCMWRK